MGADLKRLILVILSAALVIGALAVGCPATTTDNTPPDDLVQIIEDVSPLDALDLIQQNEGNANFVIIDVRTPLEYAQGHIEGAINIDFRSSAFEETLKALDRDKAYFIYCASGNRSGQARDLMEGLDFTEVYNLAGGITAWLDAGLATVRD
jgi:rhodanese-related sulfurtransferase